MSTESQLIVLEGEGEIQTTIRIKVRRRCETCNGVAIFKHTYLLEGYRSNPASSGYHRDDCSYCEDAATFSCQTCKPEIPAGYCTASRYTCGKPFAHLFLEWEEIDPSDGPISWQCCCGHTNGINLVVCSACLGKPGNQR